MHITAYFKDFKRINAYLTGFRVVPFILACKSRNFGQVLNIIFSFQLIPGSRDFFLEFKVFFIFVRFKANNQRVLKFQILDKNRTIFSILGST
jgi:hypothetical protein